MRKKILIVDDDIEILLVLRIMLERKGYVIELSSEPEKILLPGASLPDLLILDIWMGNFDGREICQQIKSDPTTQHLPIIIFSAGRDMEHSAKAAGADDFLAKPFEQKNLFEKVAKYIG